MKRFFGEPSSRIIFAADLPTFDENAKVLQKVIDSIDVIKISNPLVLTEGVSVIRRLGETFQRPIFADLKVADVPHTNARIVEIVGEHGAAAIMVHGIVGPDALLDCLEAAADRLGIIVQLELTHPGGKVFTAPLADDMANLASQLPVFGTQAPGNRPNRVRHIRRILGEGPVIVCCGVGAQGGRHQDVIGAGATYSIIGRALYNAPDPKTAVDAILNPPTSVKNDRDESELANSE